MSSGGNYFPDSSIDTLGISDVLLLVSTIVYVTGGLVRAPTAGLFFPFCAALFFSLFCFWGSTGAGFIPHIK